MGVKLIVEVLDHAPDTMTTVDRLVLVIIAENANDDTREGWPGWELLARRMRWSGQKDGGKNAVSTALAGMAKRGVDVRVPIAQGKDGRAVYAATGRRTVYRIPPLQRVAASATLSAESATTPKGWQPQPPSDPEGWQPSPPSKGGTPRHPGWQSEGVKGGNPGGQRVAPTATPSPHVPSENPHTPGRFGKIETPLPEATQIVLDGLRSEGYAEATPDDARAVHAAVCRRYPNRVTVGYLRTMAGNRSFAAFFAEIKTARAEEVEQAIRELGRTEPECEHRTPAGRTPHPTTGLLLCALCRAGAPVIPEPTERTDPAVVAALDAYRTHATGRLYARDLIRITQEAVALHNKGVTGDQLATLASKAAQLDTGLLAAATAN